MQKTIIAKTIIGRLGNQMFQYAYCKALKESIGGGTLAFSFEKVLKQQKFNNHGTTFEDSLQYFGVESYEIYKGDPLCQYGNKKQRFISKLHHILNHGPLRRISWETLLRKFGIFFYSDQKTNFLNDIEDLKKENKKRKVIICYDFLEAPELFASIRSILLKDFTPKHPPLKCNKNLYDIINSTNSVCVSVRRGDYLDPLYKEKFYICDPAYISCAIKKIKELIAKPTLVFFSDDIQWVKDNIPTDLPSYYESGNDPVWEKIRLMYSCKHFIISNSSFSWWAQYLSRNENKIVISPDHWFNDKSLDQYHLISNSFITIPCKKNNK